MSRARAPRVPCRRCGGSGWCDLPLYLFDTLRVIRRLGVAKSAADVCAALLTFGDAPEVVKPTAMSNRLAELERLGFLVGQDDGRRRIFWLAKRVSRMGRAA